MKENEIPFVRQMFDHIAPRYDFLNRLLSLRRDVVWRQVLVQRLQLGANATVLDVACGTADVALEIVRQFPDARVTGVDFAPQMLRLARPKIKAAPIVLAAADAFDMPFKPGGFNALTIAFGIRNIQNKTGVLKQFWDHLKPGGRLAILELITPTREPARSAYLFYFNRLLPVVGRFFSKHSYAYTYLPDSVAKFPPADEFMHLMRQCGFVHLRYRKLTMGIAAIFIGDKPL
jgi:demethylmenaquinone methyltransferase / 2-methoxy-6-polyprenyl-1,4-benzoquinol methylase